MFYYLQLIIHEKKTVPIKSLQSYAFQTIVH